MTLPERLQQEQEESVDRRRISEDSMRHMAEAIHFGDTDAALREMFDVLTGDAVADHPPVRDVEGEFSLGADVQLADNRSVVLDISLGEQTESAYVSAASGGAYRFGELSPGGYTISASVVEVREYDEETMDSTTYDVTDATLDYETAVTVDAQEVPIGTAVMGPAVTIAALTIDEESGGN